MMRLQSLFLRGLAGAMVLFVTAAVSPNARAQEFFCEVTVNYRQLSGAGFNFLDDFAELVREYMNEHTWTQDRFLPEERIECSMQIVFQEALTQTSFRAQIVVASRRPIYGTTQSTNVVQVNDDAWQFEYSQGTPLMFETERFNALTSVLDFYAYVMLGYDYDTFSELGGEPHFQKARRIFELAQAQSALGWDALGGGRRANIVRQLLDPRFKPLREAYFRYHFDGLDHFLLDPQRARQQVLDVIGSMQALYDELSRQYTLDLFFTSKYQELTAIFKDSPLSTQAYALLREVDASHSATYDTLVQ